jgi:hypothetical protein
MFFRSGCVSIDEVSEPADPVDQTQPAAAPPVANGEANGVNALNSNDKETDGASIASPYDNDQLISDCGLELFDEMLLLELTSGRSALTMDDICLLKDNRSSSSRQMISNSNSFSCDNNSNEHQTSINSEDDEDSYIEELKNYGRIFFDEILRPYSVQVKTQKPKPNGATMMSSPMVPSSSGNRADCPEDWSGPLSRTRAGQDKPRGHLLRPVCPAPDCDWSGALYWDCPECQLIAHTTAEQLRVASAQTRAVVPRGEQLTEQLKAPPSAAEQRAEVRSLSTTEQLRIPSAVAQLKEASTNEHMKTRTSTDEHLRTDSAAERFLDSNDDIYSPLRGRCGEEFQLYLSDKVKCGPCSLDEMKYHPGRAEELEHRLSRAPDDKKSGSAERRPRSHEDRAPPKSSLTSNKVGGEEFCHACRQSDSSYHETNNVGKNTSLPSGHCNSRNVESERRPIGDQHSRHGQDSLGEERLPLLHPLVSSDEGRGPPMVSRPPPSQPPTRPPVPLSELPPPCSPQQLLRSTAQLLGVDLVRLQLLPVHKLGTLKGLSSEN